MSVWHTTQQDDMLDQIVANHYGGNWQKAFDYVLQHSENQDLARTMAKQGYRFETGQQVYLPDLPDTLLIQTNQRQIKVFED